MRWLSGPAICRMPETEFQNLGDLLADTLNQDQDAPVMMIQQLASKVMQIIIDPGGSGQMVWDAKGRASFALVMQPTTPMLSTSARRWCYWRRSRTAGAPLACPALVDIRG
ncbi:hypothetical protein SNK04_013997 [Fusarium graminearum]